MFAKIDTEAHSELAGQAQIMSIPTLMVFRDGVRVFARAGALAPAALEELIGKVREVYMDEVGRAMASHSGQLSVNAALAVPESHSEHLSRCVVADPSGRAALGRRPRSPMRLGSGSHCGMRGSVPGSGIGRLVGEGTMNAGQATHLEVPGTTMTFELLGASSVASSGLKRSARK